MKQWRVRSIRAAFGRFRMRMSFRILRNATLKELPDGARGEIADTLV